MALIKTPHAAVIVWNYEERFSVDNSSAGSNVKVNEVIISTISLMSIATSKTKSDPVGSFELALAPTRNWTAVLTPGSWCAILMSNEPITKDSFKKAKGTQLKMIGRIDGVRTNVQVDEGGTRYTSYSVHGRDWGAIFQNVIYIDPIVQDPSDPGGTQASALYQQLVAAVYDANNDPNLLSVPDNLSMIMSIMGHPFRLPDTQRLAKATHEVTLPEELVNFLFDNVSVNKSTKFTELLSLIWGPLVDGIEDSYDHSQPNQTGLGWLDPGSFVGQHTIWSVLQDNCNYAMNDLFAEMHWHKNTPEFRLYNRIKPFSYTDNPASDIVDTSMRSMFQNVTSHHLHAESVISVSAGTNWDDKFNFLEIKPDLNELNVLGVTLKDKSQISQGTNSGSTVFDREGFRPMFFSIRQLPFEVNGTERALNTSLLQKWVHLAQEWYFDSHKFLNGTVRLQGTDEYIPVGDNVIFDAQLVGVTPNHNSGATNIPMFVLGHVESVRHEFTVGAGGERSFRTTIGFVRGIVVDKDKRLIGAGTIDNVASALSKEDSRNSVTVISEGE